MTTRNPLRFHAESLVMDAVCPLVMDDPSYLDWYREGGTTALAPTVGGWENTIKTLYRLSAWHRLLRERSDIMLVRQAADIEVAKRSGRLGIYLHFQGTDPLEDNLD